MSDHPIPATRSSVVARAILDRRVVHLRDITKATAYYSKSGRAALSYRSVLITPIRRGRRVFGAFGVGRAKASLFSRAEVASMAALADLAATGLDLLVSDGSSNPTRSKQRAG